MRFIYDDGGRTAAGYRGHAGDCVCRSIAIASGRPYDDVYRALAVGMGSQRRTAGEPKRVRSARNGICVTRKWFKDYMHSLGFRWTPTMRIGSGCTVHLHDGELPDGRLVVSVSGHYTAVIDGVIHDTYDPQRETTIRETDPVIGPVVRTVRRCVYGYWSY